MSNVTKILASMERGEAGAAERLLPLVYEELRKLAANRLAHENAGQTLQATALVHEAYLRLVGDAKDVRWENRGHFFAAAAEAMRRILVEKARRKKRLKHGGGHLRQAIEKEEPAVPEVREDILALDAALDRLQAVDETAAKLVHLRYFAGLTIAQSAGVLAISPRSADRIWAFARAWLRRELSREQVSSNEE